MFIVIFWVVMLCGLVGITIVLEECITYIVRIKYNPEDSSEHHTRRRENLKSHRIKLSYVHAV
jgi:hypothetical protein